MNAEKRARVYRFHDAVAFHTETGGTHYMTTSMAFAFANAIKDAASDICEETSFSKSTFKDREIIHLWAKD